MLLILNPKANGIITSSGISFSLALQASKSMGKVKSEQRFSGITGLKVILLFAALVAFCAQASAQADTTSGGDSLVFNAGTLKPGKDGLKTVVKYNARDSVRLEVVNRKVFLYGQAVVTYENMKLEAEFIEVNFETNDIHASGVKDSTGNLVGKPIFTSDGEPYHAEEMWYNFKTKKGVSTNVTTTMDEGYVRGEKFMKDSLDQMYIRHATYTTCSAEHPHFWISASKFKIVPGKQAISGPANLVIAGINTPVVLPFGYFPVQKKRNKGILIGKFGSRDRWGYYLSDFGYYAPISEHLDLKFTTDIYSLGSWGVGIQSNYKRRYRYDGNVLFKFNRFLTGEPESADFTSSDQYRVEWHYHRDPKAHPGRNFSANVTYMSSNQQKYTSSNVDDILATNANSTVTYSRSLFDKKLNFTLNNRITQNLTNGDLNIDLPDVTFNMSRISPFKNLGGNKNKFMILRNMGITYNGALKNSISVNQDSIFQFDNRVFRWHPDLQNNIKNGFKHAVSLNTSFKVLTYFNLSPSVNYTEVWYTKVNEKEWTGDTLLNNSVQGFSRAGWYSTSLSLTTNIYGIKYFKKGKIGAIRHVITPSISGVYSPEYSEQERYGYRNVQIDTSGKTQWYSIYDQTLYRGPTGGASASLNFNVNNSIEMKVWTKDKDGKDTLVRKSLLENLRLDGGYNFIADSLKMRNLGLSAFTTLFKKIRVNASATVDPYQFALDSNNKGYTIDKYMWEKGKMGRLKSVSVAFGSALKPDDFKKGKVKASVPEMDMRGRYFSDFSVPWDLNFNYSYTFSKNYNDDPTKNQTIKYSGNIRLTDYWRIGFSSYYNLEARKTTAGSLDFARDLHCWEFNFHWVPIGTYKQFNFELRVKSSTLKDLKIRKTESWIDAVN
ncbi:MAG: hypothetical protein GC181_13730 [Bacteroidetes bacterium]|nr:hypothetical protein [Bacteroidota bacterium]